MKRLRRWFMRKLIVRIFAEVSTRTFAHKDACEITLFDAHEHYEKPWP